MANWKWDELPVLANPLRGCGHLKEDAMYLRSELDPDGFLPAFVRFTPPVMWLDQHFRGWKAFQGIQWQWAFRPLETVEGDHHALMRNWERWCFDGERPDDVPDPVDRGPHDEFMRHLSRLEWDHLVQGPLVNQDLGHHTVAWAPDLIMWVGGSYYPGPEAFIQEVMRYGLNKRLAMTKPPTVVPGITRLFLGHLECPMIGMDRLHPALFGYSYITQAVVYTVPEQRKRIPKWLTDEIDLGRVTPVRIGPAEPDIGPEPYAAQEPEEDPQEPGGDESDGENDHDPEDE